MNRVTHTARTALALSLLLATGCAPGRIERTAQPAVHGTRSPMANQCAGLSDSHRAVETRHQISVGGDALLYTARAGLMPLREHEAGETMAHVFYVAYTVDPTPGEGPRPVTFVWNGGPGAPASILHLTGLGPKAVPMGDEVTDPLPAPTNVVDNEETWLQFTDLVFVDPVGTGYSRATREEYRELFWSARGDIDANAEFVRLYLTHYDAWDAPLFLAGESYGAGRVAGLAEALPRRGVPVTAPILISGGFGRGAALSLPSFTATAHFHRRLPVDLRGDLDATLRAAEAWATGVYAPALADLDGLTADARREIVTGLARFTGLDPQSLDTAELPLQRGDFGRLLLEAEGLEVGHYDARMTQEMEEYEGPYDPRVDAALRVTLDILDGTSVLLRRYLTHTLGFACDLAYAGPFGGFWPPASTFRGDWMTMRWDRTSPGANTDGSVAMLDRALTADPDLRVFVAMGIYDLVTTYLPARMAMSRLEAAHPGAISFVAYEGGHSMYHGKSERARLMEDVAAFMESAARSAGGHGDPR